MTRMASVRPDSVLITRLLASDAPLSEADTLRAAAQRFAVAAESHRDDPAADPVASDRLAAVYQECADILHAWAANGGVPRLGHLARERWSALVAEAARG